MFSAIVKELFASVSDDGRWVIFPFIKMLHSNLLSSFQIFGVVLPVANNSTASIRPLVANNQNGFFSLSVMPGSIRRNGPLFRVNFPNTSPE